MVDEQKLRQLAEAATPGPWVTGNTDPLLFGSPRNPGTEPIGFVYGPSFAERSELGRKALSTSEYIATANPAAILSLLDRVKALEEGLNGVLLCGRGTSGRIILEGWQEEAARALLEKTT